MDGGIFATVTSTTSTDNTKTCRRFTSSCLDCHIATKIGSSYTARYASPMKLDRRQFRLLPN